MTYAPSYPKLAPWPRRGYNPNREWSRPPGLPYPQDPTYQHLVGRVDDFRMAYLTKAEIYKHRSLRRKWIESVTTDDDGCWIWAGIVTNTGTPLIWTSRCRSAFVWMIEQWFPHLRHQIEWKNGLVKTATTCGKKLCVRPQCRYKASSYDKPTYEHASPRKLTADQVREVRRRHQAGESARAIAEDLPVSYHSVGQILRGKSYAWVTEDPANDPPGVYVWPADRDGGRFGRPRKNPEPQRAAEGAS